MKFDQTYQLAKGPPAMGWEDYTALTMARLRELINTDPPVHESVLHDLLEQNPSLVPGSFSLPLFSGNTPIHDAVISKPKLQGLTSREPDFLWLAQDSATFYPVLVEIERPDKKWFKEDGFAHGDLTHALGQFVQWRRWFAQGNHKELFLDLYRVPESVRRWKAFHPLFVLVHGRRREFEQRPHNLALRNELANADEYLMTWDRVAPSRRASSLVSIQVTVHGTFKAIGVPASFELSPWIAQNIAGFRGVDEAIRRSEWMTDARREFLLSRLPYWQWWARHEETGIITSGDRE